MAVFDNLILNNGLVDKTRDARNKSIETSESFISRKSAAQKSLENRDFQFFFLLINHFWLYPYLKLQFQN